MRLLALIAVAVFAASVLVSATTTVDYAVDWNEAPTTAPQRVSTTVSTFGSCMCDVSAVCDANCCCDAQCDNNELNVMFTSCDKEVAGTDTVVLCSSRNSGTKIVRSTQEIQYSTPVAQDAVCVVRTGIPADMSPYFKLPSDATVGAMVPPAVPTWPKPTASSTVGSNYFAVGSKLPYLKASGTPITVTTENTGYFFDPRPIGRGRRCSNDKLTTFLNEHNPEQCAHNGTLATLCTTTLDASKSKFFALTLPSGSILATGSVASGVVSMRHVVVDTDGNVIENINPQETFVNALGLNSRRALATSGTASWDAADNVCRNALLSRRVNIAYTTSTGGASLYNATVTYTVGDVVGNSANLYWVSYSTHFARMDLSGATAVPLPATRAGYLSDNPVLAGRIATNGDKTVVVPRVSGFTIPSGGLCSDQRQVGVRFGHNVQDAGCFVSLSLDALRTSCATNDGTTALLRQALTPVGTGANVSWVLDRFGFVANANYANINDWVTVQDSWSPLASSTTSAPSYSALTQSCSNAIVGLQWVIGVSQSGIEYNPQDVITGVQLKPITGTWSYRGTGSTSLFKLSFQVSFVRVPASLDARPIVPPNILPTVDEDVFFPFRRASDQTQDTS